MLDLSGLFTDRIGSCLWTTATCLIAVLVARTSSGKPCWFLYHFHLAEPMEYHCLPTPILIPSCHLDLLSCNCFSSVLVPDLESSGWLESSVCGFTLGPQCLDPGCLGACICTVADCRRSGGTGPRSGGSGACGESAAIVRVLCKKLGSERLSSVFRYHLPSATDALCLGFVSELYSAQLP